MISWLKSHGWWPFHVAWSEWTSTLLTGLLHTIEFAALGFLAAAVLGLVLALMRTSRIWLVRLPAAIYTEVFKNIPLLVIISVTYYGIVQFGIKLGVFEAGALSLAIFYAAYLSEIFRSALVGVQGAQREAAQALGLTRWSTFAHVVFPQALRLALPGTNTMLVDLLKSTSLLTVIAAGELMAVGNSVASQTFEQMEVFLVIGAIYFAVCYPLSQALLFLERRVSAGAPLSLARYRRLRAARQLLEPQAVGGTA